jgi:hypothetical protein
MQQEHIRVLGADTAKPVPPSWGQPCNARDLFGRTWAQICNVRDEAGRRICEAHPLGWYVPRFGERRILTTCSDEM